MKRIEKMSIKEISDYLKKRIDLEKEISSNGHLNLIIRVKPIEGVYGMERNSLIELVQDAGQGREEEVDTVHIIERDLENLKEAIDELESRNRRAREGGRME